MVDDGGQGIHDHNLHVRLGPAPMRYGTLVDVNYIHIEWSVGHTDNVLTLQAHHVSASQVVHHGPGLAILHTRGVFDAS